METELEETNINTIRSQETRLRVKDIIAGFSEFFATNVEVLPVEQIEYLLSERFDKLQWRYIKKCEQESKS